MRPRNLGFEAWVIHEDMSDFVKSTSLECISTTLFFNIISPSGICFLIEHDTKDVIMKHNKMIFTTTLRTISNFLQKYDFFLDFNVLNP